MISFSVHVFMNNNKHEERHAFPIPNIPRNSMTTMNKLAKLNGPKNQFATINVDISLLHI